MPQQKKEPDALSRAIGDVLRGLARAERMSQKELAAASGIDKTSVQRYLAGTRNITVTDLGALSRALHTTAVKVTLEAEDRLNRPPVPQAPQERTDTA